MWCCGTCGFVGVWFYCVMCLVCVALIGCCVFVLDLLAYGCGLYALHGLMLGG